MRSLVGSYVDLSLDILGEFYSRVFGFPVGLFLEENWHQGQATTPTYEIRIRDPRRLSKSFVETFKDFYPRLSIYKEDLGDPLALKIDASSEKRLYFSFPGKRASFTISVSSELEGESSKPRYLHFSFSVSPVLTLDWSSFYGSFSEDLEGNQELEGLVYDFKEEEVLDRATLEWSQRYLRGEDYLMLSSLLSLSRKAYVDSFPRPGEEPSGAWPIAYFFLDPQLSWYTPHSKSRRFDTAFQIRVEPGWFLE